MSISAQRELIAGFKKDIYLNVSLLSVIHPAACEISKLIFKEESYEKPTQHFFMHLSFYLANIIDYDKAKTFSWPLYDSQKEKKYRTDLTKFIAVYASKGIISPVLSSFFVNPGCFKVVRLMLQLSQLAMEKTLLSKINTDTQKKLYSDVAHKLKTEQKSVFLDFLEQETIVMKSKFSLYQHKKSTMECIASTLQRAIIEKEAKLKELNEKLKLNEWIDEFLNKNLLSDNSKIEIALLKDPKKQNPIFDKWLNRIDIRINNIETEWNNKGQSFINSSKTLRNYSETLISRYTGDCDRKSYILEYNPKSDVIATVDLEQHVNSQQKYVLKNIIQNGKLQFPNLLLGFVISIGYIFKNHRVENLKEFNDGLDHMLEQFKDLKMCHITLNQRVIAAEKKIQTPSRLTKNHLFNTNQLIDIPPLQDFSDLKANTHIAQNASSFTPLNTSKYQFNLRKKTTTATFNKPYSRSLNLITPFHPGPKDDFLRTVKAYQLNMTSQNNSLISQATNTSNVTIAECSTGFTKQQLQRLLSTKKSSIKKKRLGAHKYSRNLKMGKLFDESQESVLLRSHSSPNLLENSDKPKVSRMRKLHVMRDASLLEVSGIEAIGTDSRESTQSGINQENSQKKLPKILITPVLQCEESLIKKIKEFDFVSPIENLNDQQSFCLDEQNTKHFSCSVQDKQNNILKKTDDVILTSNTYKNLSSLDEVFNVSDVTADKSELEKGETINVETKTPLTKPVPEKQLSSLEKIINRYKRVRANVVNTEIKEVNISLDKENIDTNNVKSIVAPKFLLPDIIGSSCNNLENNYKDSIKFINTDFKVINKRESLGTMLGVDESILDDLID